MKCQANKYAQFIRKYNIPNQGKTETTFTVLGICGHVPLFKDLLTTICDELNCLFYFAKKIQYAYRIRGTDLRLLKSYLTDHTQYVIYDGTQSMF